jgi:hypothetical protein
VLVVVETRVVVGEPAVGDEGVGVGEVGGVVGDGPVGDADAGLVGGLVSLLLCLRLGYGEMNGRGFDS